MSKLLFTAVIALGAASVAAHSTPVQNAQTNLANPEYVIGFDEVAGIAGNTVISDEFTGLGAEFSGMRYSPNGFASRPNTDGSLLFDFPITDAAIIFNFAVTDATFALGSNNGTGIFTSFLHGMQVESFSTSIAGTAAPGNTVGNVFGFATSLFDEIRFTTTGSSGASFDNLSFNAADPEPIPLPASLPLLLAGLAGFGFIRSRQRR